MGLRKKKQKKKQAVYAIDSAQNKRPDEINGNRDYTLSAPFNYDRLKIVQFLRLIQFPYGIY